jgi:NAD(P)-dependent dehydrogenase (short-subunit alcohol dehydrogenase family)
MSNERSGAGQTAVVTGGTRGIGLATARNLAGRGYRVVVTGRGQAASDEAAAAIKAHVSGADVVGMALDLSSLARIRAFAAAYRAKGWPLHVLVNNAGQLALDAQRRVTEDGIETTLAINAIGPFVLTHLLLDLLAASAPARVVSVGSRVHLPRSNLAGGEVDWRWDDWNVERAFNPVVAYKNSKLATMWFTYELNRRLSGKGVTVNAVCPGFVPETLAEHKKGLSAFLYKHLMPHVPGARSVAQAAANTTFAVTAEKFATQGGVFIGEEREVPSSEQSHDEEQARRFFALASRLGELD